MKMFLRSIFSCFLAFLVLVSTTSFSVEKHFCGGHLVDVAFFGEARPCAMEMALAKRSGCDTIQKSDCCSDEIFVLEGQDELKLNWSALDFDTAVFLSTDTLTSYLDLFEGLEEHFVPFDGYPPPLITHNYFELFEQHLI